MWIAAYSFKWDVDVVDAFIWHNGTVRMSLQIRQLRIVCPMDTFKFPFDKQTCSFFFYIPSPNLLQAIDLYAGRFTYRQASARPVNASVFPFRST